LPSRQDVLDAQQQVTDTRRSVDAIQADLAAANAELESLNTTAEQAAEAYNGAVLRWHDARTAAITARRQADQAAANAADARAELAGYVVAQQTSGTQLTAFSTALGAGGQHDLLESIANSHSSSQAYDAQYQQWQASSELAKVYQARAEAALEKAAEAKAAAQRARAAAQAAVERQQAAVVAIDAQRESLLQELAEAQHISVALATQRQQGLEQRRRERIAEQRRLEALARQRAEHRRELREQAEQRRDHLRELRQQRRERHQHDTTNTPAPTPPAPPPPAPAPPPVDPTPPPPDASSAQVAIDFARDQLGEPYVWGAAGPDSWDCSGLTMGAWAAAGVSLPHYSVAQYAATTPVSVSQLRPGDLVFWASNSSDPDTIFHVGLYIGDGEMIHAPHTGAVVRVESIWYWETPDFFGRPG
jgi:cell wall-associated NlpC family hydrolase